MIPLPIDPSLPQILQSLRDGPGLVLIAAPGSGKTTRVPAAIVRSGLLGADSSVGDRPPAAAGRGAGGRGADRRRAGLDPRPRGRLPGPVRAPGSASTRLLIETEGVLTRQMLADPFLESVGAVVLDEFHERSLHTDLALGLLREIRREVRPDLRIIVMSATLDAEPVARFLGRAGRRGSRPGLSRSRSNTARPNVRPIPRRSPAAVASALADRADRGHVLVFLPGTAEIRRALPSNSSRWPLGAGADVLPLHGSLPTEEQDRALAAVRSSQDHRGDEHRRDLADDRRGDDCDRRRARPGRPSRPPARAGPARPGTDQPGVGRPARRAGRADRPRALHPACGPSAGTRRSNPFDEPEVHRVDLGSTVLALHVMGRPRARAVRLVRAAVEATGLTPPRRCSPGSAPSNPKPGAITPLGERMLAMPVHPRLGRLLLAAAAEGLVHEGAASPRCSRRRISSSARRSARRQRAVAVSSDVLPRLDLLAEAEAARFGPMLRGRGIDPSAARQVVAGPRRFDADRGSRLEGAARHVESGRGRSRGGAPEALDPGLSRPSVRSGADRRRPG